MFEVWPTGTVGVVKPDGGMVKKKKKDYEQHEFEVYIS